MDIQLIGIALLSFGMFLAVLAVLFRITRQESAILWMTRAFIGTGIVVGMTMAGSWGVTEYVWWASFYGLITVLFVFGIFSLMEASLTLRILAEIAQSGNGISAAHLLKKYNRFSITKRRIARLLYSGEIIQNQEMYTRGKTSYFGVREVFLKLFRKLFPR
jgi:uncharacterized membrane protein YjfL (UPF0719 family)